VDASLGLVQDVREALAAAADPDAAVALARYFQVRPGGYGEGDYFIGVKLSNIRRLVASHLRTPFVPAEWWDLLHSPVHEERLAALVVMADRAARGQDAERELIYDTYLAATQWIDNWDLVDVSAAPVVGGCLLMRDRTPLYLLAASALIWERRIAMVATHQLIRAGETEDTYRLAVALRADREDLIQKAVGWMLREAGARVDEAELRGFLAAYAPELPRTTLRYAVERFPTEVALHFRQLP
jgi:3-methyladenine DNA glycosylase AlkD